MKPVFSTLTDLYNFATSRYPRKTASGFAGGGQCYTYFQFKECCDNISRILSNFGIGASDKVAILSENMPNWSIAFFAITAFGRIAVPMLPDLSHDEVENILAHSGAKAIFISRKQLGKLSEETVKRLNLVIDIEDFNFIKAMPHPAKTSVLLGLILSAFSKASTASSHKLLFTSANPKSRHISLSCGSRLADFL